MLGMRRHTSRGTTVSTGWEVDLLPEWRDDSFDDAVLEEAIRQSRVADGIAVDPAPHLEHDPDA